MATELPMMQLPPKTDLPEPSVLTILLFVLAQHLIEPQFPVKSTATDMM
jgi:hypothetical protein